MEQNIPNFFAEKGMTSTSANHLANIAKEVIRDKETELAAIRFYSESVELLNSEKKLLKEGYNKPERIGQLIEEIAAMYSFSAWAREAIKRKDEMLNELEAMDNVKYCHRMGIELPTHPISYPEPTEQDVLDEMNIKERNEYYTLEAFAATYGKHIHPDGDIAQARLDLQRVAKSPSTVQGVGRDAMVYTYEPTVSVDKVDSTFFALQSQYRAFEARLNRIKAQIATTLKNKKLQAIAAFEDTMKEYNRALEEITLERRRYVTEQRAVVANLKIAIPESLRATYDFLNSLGKEEKRD